MPNNNKKNTNPTGKGGFNEHPENISKFGRRKKYLTLLLEEIGEETEPKSGKKFKELLARRVWVDALNGNGQARELIFNYIEGLPQSFHDITSDGESIKILITEESKKQEDE